MTRVLSALVIGGLVSAAFGDDVVVGSGKVVAERRELGEFDQIELRIAADVYVKIGEALPLEVEADDNILPLIKTELRDGRLVVFSNSSFTTKHAPDLKVRVASLKGVKIGGSGDMHVDGLDNRSFSVDIDGTADVHLSGKTQQLAISISGSGDVLAFGLKARDASVAISGTGDAKVNVAKSLNVVIAGSGDVRYEGDPVVHKIISGSGKIGRRAKS